MDPLNQQQNTNPINNNPRTIPVPPQPAPAQPAPNPVPPPPPMPPAAVQTMHSDTSSMQTAGGSMPQPQFATPAPHQASPVPSAPASQPAPAPATPEPRRVSSALLWFAMLAVIVSGASLLYTYGLPLLLTEQPAPAPAAAPAPEPQPAAPAGPATTLFGTPIASVVIIQTETSLAAIQDAVRAEAQKEGAPPFTEFVLQSASGPIAPAAMLRALLPELAAAATSTPDALDTAFDGQLSGFIYRNENGAWPGYVARLAPADDLIAVADRLFDIESASYKNFFVADPGTTAGFRTGQVKDLHVHRFAPFSATGAEFSYGIFGDYFIVSTSPDSLAKALELLGL